MNTAITQRTFNFLAIIAVMLALFAGAALPGAHAAAANNVGGDSPITITPDFETQLVTPGQIVARTYVLTNNGSEAIKVRLAAKNDRGWSLSLSDTEIKVPARSTATFELKVAVPATDNAQSTTAIAAYNPNVGVTASLVLQPRDVSAPASPGVVGN